MESLEPCHSEASNISATSEESPTKDDNKKEKAEEGSTSKHEPTSSHLVLDLKLANDELMTKGANPYNSNLELNLFNSSNYAGESSNEGSKTFTCNFCRRQFSTSQALGGHQNAHKQERALAKHRHSVVDMTASSGSQPPLPFGHLGYNYYAYSTFPQVPFYGTAFNRSLGVRAESMIHKPYPYHPPWSSLGYRFGHEKVSYSRANCLINPPSSALYDRLRMESSQSHQISGSGLGLDDFGANPNFGVCPNPNPITTTNTCNAAATNANGADSNNGLRLGNFNDGVDQVDASGLDLNLKL